MSLKAWKCDLRITETQINGYQLEICSSQRAAFPVDKWRFTFESRGLRPLNCKCWTQERCLIWFLLDAPCYDSNSCTTFDSTSLADKLSSSTCLSTPRSIPMSFSNNYLGVVWLPTHQIGQIRVQEFRMPREWAQVSLGYISWLWDTVKVWILCWRMSCRTGSNMANEHEANYCWCDITDRVPADAAPECEQSTRTSRIAGEKALVNDMVVDDNYVSDCFRGWTSRPF